jgi:hypothetical protein
VGQMAREVEQPLGIPEVGRDDPADRGDAFVRLALEERPRCDGKILQPRTRCLLEIATMYGNSVILRPATRS